MTVLYTIGYEGVRQASLLAVLLENGVEEVVDVRLTPLSRKPGFSKNALTEALTAEGIGYSHEPDLGCPKEIRVSYRETADFAEYARAYRRRVLARATATVKDLALLATAKRTCILCFESDARRCHRSLVAEAARRANGEAIAVEDLAVPSSGRTSR
jgi:uncharacterized protein (DUF488 family)